MYMDVQMEELTAGLGPKENSTKTMGVRRTEAARVAGEGAHSLMGSHCAWWWCEMPRLIYFVVRITRAACLLLTASPVGLLGLRCSDEVRSEGASPWQD